MPVGTVAELLFLHFVLNRILTYGFLMQIFDTDVLVFPIK